MNDCVCFSNVAVIVCSHKHAVFVFIQGSIFLFFAGRIEEIKGNLDAVSDLFSLGESVCVCVCIFNAYQ